MIKVLKYIFFEPGRSLEHQMFIFGSIAVMLGLVSALLISILAPLSGQLTIASAVATVICSVAIAYSFKTKNFFRGNIVLVVFAVYITFPIGILVGGGIYSGTPIWFIIAMVYIAMVFKGKPFWILTIVGLAIFVGTAYYSFQHPELFQIELTEEFRFVHITSSVVGVSLLIALLVRYQQIVFAQENLIAHEQKEEIQALSDAQSRFFSSMSHEIRTPLNTIIGLNEMTLRDQNVSEEVAENAANIQNASRMLLALVNDVLDLSKIESGRMELAESQYETSRMLSDVVNLLWGRAKEKHLQFEMNVGENIPSMLYGDEMRLKQVIINVLANAIKYTESGSVTLTIDGETRGANEFMLRIDVDDTGIGIRKEALPYLFDSFKRVDVERNKNVEGTGLGLAISKQLVDLMGGTITVDSIFTKGSHFQIEVPQRIANAEPMQYRSVTSRSDASTYENIFEAPDAHVLIVDDNDMNRMVSRKLLRATRVQADVASSGAECLEKTAETRYDVIFMDHEMPEMDGIETLRRIREQVGGLCKGTPVVALTANAGSDMNAFYLNQGFQGYLAKPIHGSLLEATLLQFLPAELIERTSAEVEGETLRVSATRRKRAIAVTVDCPCDLPDSMLAEYNITRMPFYIITERGRFRDVEEIDADNLFAHFEAGGTARTHPATVEEYESFFGNMLDEAETVLHLSMSSKVSRAYDVACQAASSFGNVQVVDSYQFSSGLGLMALRASQLASAGTDLAEIVEDLDAYSDKVMSTVLVSSFDSPIIRIGMPAPLRALVHLLSWEPVLHLKRSGLKLAGFHGGYVSEAPAKYVKSAMRRAVRKGDGKVLFVTFSGCSLEEQRDILEQVNKLSNFEQVVQQKASATVAANTWLHSFGIMYAKE